jgi:hypothetical protein
MNKDEKEMITVLGAATATLAAVCILSLQQCTTMLLLAATAVLLSYAWTHLTKLLMREVERASHEES